MRLRLDPLSKADRFASTAAASGVTIVTGLIVLMSVPTRFALVSTPAPSHEERVTQRIAYVSPVVPRPVTRRAEDRPGKRVTPQSRVSAPARAQVAAPAAPVVADSSAGAQPSPNAARSAVSDFERRWTAHGVSPLLLPSTPAGPAFGGAANPPGATWRAPDSEAARDAQLRAQAMAAIAARTAGAPMSTTPRGGISIDAPIPFGGPSNAQRKRDSTINAQTKAVLARVRQRLDSIAAARRKRADSLAALEKHP